MAVRVPNSQFLPPYIDIADNGSRVYNNSIREFLYNSIGKQPATLGRYFFTSAHLTVNHDSNSFTLSAANATTESELVPIVSEPKAKSCSDGTADTGATVTAGSAATTQGSSRHTSPGAIAGGVVGGVVVGLAAVGAAAFVMVRRRRRRENSHELPAGSVSHQGPLAQYNALAPVDVNMNQEKWTETHEMGVYHSPRELLGRKVLQSQQSFGPVYEMSGDTQTVHEIGHD